MGPWSKVKKIEKEAVDYRQKEIEKQQGKFIFSGYFILAASLGNGWAF